VNRQEGKGLPNGKHDYTKKPSSSKKRPAVTFRQVGVKFRKKPKPEWARQYPDFLKGKQTKNPQWKGKKHNQWAARSTQ